MISKTFGKMIHPTEVVGRFFTRKFIAFPPTSHGYIVVNFTAKKGYLNVRAMPQIRKPKKMPNFSYFGLHMK